MINFPFRVTPKPEEHVDRQEMFHFRANRKHTTVRLDRKLGPVV